MIILTILAPAFFVTAMLYAMVGFGGGSTYNAFLALADTDYRLMPSIALLCNLVVVSGGTYRFAKAGYLPYKRAVPWIITSVPAAWLGGYIVVPERFFIGLLGFALLAAGVLLAGAPEKRGSREQEKPLEPPLLVPLAAGGALGFLAGMVGIGGGIFLAPLLYLLRWGNARVIAATCSFFILVNSLAGLLGQAVKLADLELLAAIGSYWLLLPAVLVGGQIGSYLGAKRIDPGIIRLLTGLLILYVAVRLLWRCWTMA